MKKILISFLILNTAFLASSIAAPKTWKGLMISGDNSIKAFDQARKDLKNIWVSRGMKAENIRELSAEPSEQKNGVLPLTMKSLSTALNDLVSIQANACIVFVTSHGISEQGIFFHPDAALGPNGLHRILKAICGDLPTVVLVSACYSGQFITSETKTDNRVILTAATHDRQSFGCSADETYTYWDRCLIENFKSSKKWSDLYPKLTKCIDKLETNLKAEPSFPQAFFGSDVKDLEIL